MQYSLSSKAREPRIPDIGECWKINDFDTVYMRINDSDGRKVLPSVSSKDAMFSVDIKTGEIGWIDTVASRPRIVCLKPVVPIVFENN